MNDQTSLKRFLISSVAALAVLTGCHSTPTRPVAAIQVPPPPVLPPERAENVWYPDQIAPYAVGRYIDSRDHNVVHEAHTIYRREQTSHPNLTPPAALVFPPVAGPPAINDTVMFRDALTAELNQQRATSRAILDQAKALDQQLRRLNAQSREFQDTLQELGRVREQFLTVSNRLESIERQFGNLPSAPSTKPAATMPASAP